MSAPADLTILADDLSGAAETAAAFLDREPLPTLALHAGDADRLGVTVVDLDSRTLAEPEADRILHTALAAIPDDRLVMYKIDSLLRGHVGAAVDTLARRGPVVLAAGLPTLRRSVRGGVPYVDGVPLHQTDLWHWESVPPPRTVAELLRRPACDGLSAHDIPSALAAGTVAVCDVASDGDLDDTVRIALSVRGVQFVGTSALAAALARTLPALTADTAAPTRDHGGSVLVVVGTAAGSASDQVGALREYGAAHHELHAADVLAGAADTDALAALLTAHPVVVVTMAGATDPEHRRALAAALGRLVAAADRGTDLVLTGGETARAVIDALGVRSLRPVDVVHHGAVVSQTPDGRRIVTRPGSFGDRTSLVDAVTHLASAQRQTLFTATTLRNQS